MGPVTFYHVQWVREVLKHGGTNRQHLPSELLTGGTFFDLEDLPEGNDTTLVRVDLGKGVFTDAVRLAREQTEAIAVLASFRTGEHRWLVLDGYLYVADGRIVAKSTFMPTQDDIGNWASVGGMGPELDRLKTDLASQLPISDPDLTETIDAVRWWQEAKAQPPLPAIILDVRVLELIATRVTNESWHEYVNSYLVDAWVREKICSTLHEVVYEAVHVSESMIPEQHYAKLDVFQKLIFSHRPGGHMADLGNALDVLPELASFFPRHDRLGRRIHTLAGRLTSPATLTQWSDGLREQWDLAKGRLQRIRNALTHGGPLELASAETIDRFAAQLASWALSLRLEGMLDGRGAITAHNDFKAKSTNWLNSIRSAPNTKGALFDS